MAEPLVIRAGHLLEIESGVLREDRRLLVDRDGRIEAILAAADPGPDPSSTSPG